jgi:hypothetical protein
MPFSRNANFSSPQHRHYTQHTPFLEEYSTFEWQLQRLEELKNDIFSSYDILPISSVNAGHHELLKEIQMFWLRMEVGHHESRIDLRRCRQPIDKFQSQSHSHSWIEFSSTDLTTELAFKQSNSTSLIIRCFVCFMIDSSFLKSKSKRWSPRSAS